MTRFLTSLGNEVRKGLTFAWSERLQILIELPMFAVFVLLLGPVLGADHQITGGHVRWSLSSGRTSALVLWAIPFMFYYMQIVKMFWRLLGEIQSGTLEQVYLSPLPSWLVVAAGRVGAALIESALVAGGTYGIVSAFVPLHYHWTAAALLPLALIVVTGTGVSVSYVRPEPRNWAVRGGASLERRSSSGVGFCPGADWRSSGVLFPCS